MKKRSLRQNTSGQVLVVTSLLIALLLLTTAMFVIEGAKKSSIVASGDDDVFPAYQQSIRNTLISALANVTGGGNSTVLTDDLDELNSAITMYSYQDIVYMSYVPLNVAPYQNGVWVSWGSSGYGVSSVCASFFFNSSGLSTTSNMVYTVNLTSEVNLAGSYTQIDTTSKQVNLTAHLLNEGKPALAQNFTFYFENGTDWILVDSPIIVDFGNGTYNISFTAQIGQPSDQLVVSTMCLDQRGISIGANITCSAG